MITIGTTNLICLSTGKILRFNKRLKSWTICGNTTHNGYIECKIEKNVFKNHRLIAYSFGIIPDLNSPLEIDHIDRDKTNNSISNLRAVTPQQNSFNKNAKGYCWSKFHKKWHSEIRVHRKLIHLGYFDTEQEARQAYLNAKAIYHVI